MRTVVLLLAVVMTLGSSWAQEAPAKRAEVLVLGTYHMANPGQDVFNMQADDVLSPKRQQEIAQLIAVLKRFQPTKIAVEADVGSKRVEREYSEYLAGKYALSRNEIDQIGYRLAKELGHPKVFAVDVDGDFPLLRVINYAKANGRAEEYEALMKQTGARIKEQNEFLASHTVLDTLLYMNSDAMAQHGVSEYYKFLPFGEPWEYAGPDLLASWYQRNIRIYHNIRRLAESPSDRILVIYGAGHLGWLQQNAANDPAVRLRKLAEFTAKP